MAEKIRIPCSHAKKIRIRNLRFRKIHFRDHFEKLHFGARAFSKSSGYVRICVTVSLYLGSKSSVFEKTWVRVHVALVPRQRLKSQRQAFVDLPFFFHSAKTVLVYRKTFFNTSLISMTSQASLSLSLSLSTTTTTTLPSHSRTI